jgi:8-oxo-dGTP diphosphatase
MPPPYCYSHPRPAVTVDVVVFALRKGRISVLLVRRKNEPFLGRWALPGGFLEIAEAIPDGALRELREETGLNRVGMLAPLDSFGAIGRDPRGRTISLAHVGLVRPPIPKIRGGDDAAAAAWLVADEVSGLAFDHDLILDDALDWLDRAVNDGGAGLALLPKSFTDEHVRTLHEALGSTARAAVAWRRRLERTGRIERLSGPVVKYREVTELFPTWAPR